MYYVERRGRLGALLEYVMELMYPMGTYCLCCGKYIDISRTYCLCDNCIRHISFGHIRIDFERERKNDNRTGYLDSAISCMVYGTYSRRLIFDLKYDGRTYVSRALAQIMTDRILTDQETLEMIMDTDYVIPVPLNKHKEKIRGFNQAELMAVRMTDRLYGRSTPLEISQNLHLKVLKNALVRVRDTRAQRSVSGSERYLNLENAFEVRDIYKQKLEGKNVLVIDDIFTTGSTADRCAKVLKQAGVGRVDFMSLATGNRYLYGEI